MNDDDQPYCSDGCGRPATTDRLVGVVGDHHQSTLVYELICQECA